VRQYPLTTPCCIFTLLGGADYLHSDFSVLDCTHHGRASVCEALPIASPMKITVPVTSKIKEQTLGKPQRRESPHARAFSSHYQLHVASW